MKRAFPVLFLLTATMAFVLASAQDNPAEKSGSNTSNKAVPHNKRAMIREALSAAPPAIAKTATVKDWDGNVLKQGSGEYVCFPTPPPQKSIGKEPMCLDKVWQSWADAWVNHKDFKADTVGIAYMLEGDTGASNTDPYATKRTADNQWVVSGPHTMVVVPDKAAMDSISTDPNNGGPFVMWKGTPYEHIMVPVGNMKTESTGLHTTK